MIQIQTVARDDTWRLLTCRNCFVASWKEAPTVDRFRKMAQTGNELADRYPEGVLFLNVIGDGTPRFSPEVRAEASRLSSEQRPGRLGTAHIIAVSGIRGVATRTFLSTVMLMSRPAAPTKVFAGIDEATPWLLELLSANPHVRWSAADLRELFDAAMRPAS